MSKRVEVSLIIVIVLITLAVLGFIIDRKLDKEFPPFATLSSGSVEIRVMDDPKNQWRLKRFVNMATLIGWERYPAETPVNRCIIKPINQDGYEASCEVTKSGATSEPNVAFITDNAMPIYLWKLSRVSLGSR